MQTNQEISASVQTHKPFRASFFFFSPFCSDNQKDNKMQNLQHGRSRPAKAVQWLQDCMSSQDGLMMELNADRGLTNLQPPGLRAAG